MTTLDQNSTTQDSTMDLSENQFDKTAPLKTKEIREFGAEMTNHHMQPFVNHGSSKSLLTMVPIATDVNSKVSPCSIRAL